MGEEAGFLSALEQTPADDTTRLVYADWLDEQGNPAHAARAEFIRVELRLLTDENPLDDPDRLQQLASGLDTAWLTVVSHPEIEACRYRLIRPCPGRWHLLTPTRDANSRFCQTCAKSIRFCPTTTDAWAHIWRGDAAVISPAVLWSHAWGRIVPLPITPVGVIEHGPPLLERQRRLPRLVRSRAWMSEQASRPEPETDGNATEQPSCPEVRLPRRRDGGRRRNRNIQRENWEEEE